MPSPISKMLKISSKGKSLFGLLFHPRHTGLYLHPDESSGWLTVCDFLYMSVHTFVLGRLFSEYPSQPVSYRETQPSYPCLRYRFSLPRLHPDLARDRLLDTEG